MEPIDPEGQTIHSGSLVPSDLESEPSLEAERALVAGRYEIVSLLGAGGMGAVYTARDLQLDELVALKMMRRDLAGYSTIIERFRQEVRLARKVTSPHVARTFDIGLHGEDHFLTMELVEGESLAARLARVGALDVAELLRIAAAVAGGLAAAHSAGVIHRDLKPENVLCARDGGVKVTDFGIAKARAEAGARGEGPIGTPAYMAPEQVTAEVDLDERADVYSFGCLLYEMATGEPAWNGPSPMAIAAARLVRDPPDPRGLRPDLPAALAELTLTCLARDRGRRPATGAALVSAIQTLEHTLGRGALSVPPLVSLSPAALQREAALKRVCVAPLENAGDAADAHLASGLTDELVDGLSMSPGLRVIARGAAQGRVGVDPRALGAELGVHVVVAGRLRRAGDRVRVTLRVESVVDGVQLWTRRVERPLSELLELGDELTGALARALSVDHVGKARPTIAPEALELVLRARHEFHGFGLDGLTRALELLDQARRIAPDDPLVLSTYASVTVRRLSLEGPTASWPFAVATEAAERAVLLAPDVAEAQLALSSVRVHELRLVDAASHVRRALDLSPSNAEARLYAGRILLDAARFDEALAHLRIAGEIDPRLVMARLDLMRALVLMGRRNEAADRALAQASDPKTPWAFWATVMRLFGTWQRHPALEVLLEQLEGMSPDEARARGVDPRFASSIRDAIAGRYSPERVFAVRSHLGSPENTSYNKIFGQQLVTELLVSSGYVELARPELATAVRIGLSDRAWLERCPALEPLRADPGFPEMLALVTERADAAADALGR